MLKNQIFADTLPRTIPSADVIWVCYYYNEKYGNKQHKLFESKLSAIEFAKNCPQHYTIDSERRCLSQYAPHITFLHRGINNENVSYLDGKIVSHKHA